MYNLDPYASRRLSKEEQEIVKYIKPKYQKEFAKLSKNKRARIIRNIALDLQRRGHDISELEVMNNDNGSYLAYKTTQYTARATTKPIRMAIKHKRKIRDTKYYVKREAMKIGMRPNDNNKKFNKAFDKLNGKVEKKNVRLAKRQKLYSKIGAKLDVFFKSNNFSGGAKKDRDINEIRQAYEKKMLDKLKSKAGKSGLKVGGKALKGFVKLIIKLVAALISFIMSILPILAIVLVVVMLVLFIYMFFVSLFSAEEERLRAEQQGIYGNYSISADVERYRARILKECKKYHREKYIDLYLAVVMQESGGKGTDIFQCSESTDKPINTVDASIKQGVKYLSGMLKRAKPKTEADIPKIKIALQGYNMSGGYIDFISSQKSFSTSKSTVGKWTQESVLAYQKIRANGKKRDEHADLLGPYAYGDAYYTEHVLRYYPLASGIGNIKVKVGQASKVAKNNRLNWLFNGSPPKNQVTMQKYLQRIDVPIYVGKGKRRTMVLTVHKKLASEYYAIFTEMCKIKFPIKSYCTSSYVWRPIAGTNTLSQHSYGAAIDVNWVDNPQMKAPFVVKAGVPARYGKYSYDPKPKGKNKYAVTKQVIEIWKAHGFVWGGTWLNNTDTMHFSYTEW